ncbi:MAG: AIR synthase-related protein [Anaplasmataceae bacterium]|nr:AIR synthase-related protein [Candidatus Heimdallarchaeota archaeon]MDH5796520.1 AIR synthase-related protein [Anaplasmataceae bacterium]
MIIRIEILPIIDRDDIKNDLAISVYEGTLENDLNLDNLHKIAGILTNFLHFYRIIVCDKINREIQVIYQNIDYTKQYIQSQTDEKLNINSNYDIPLPIDIDKLEQEYWKKGASDNSGEVFGQFCHTKNVKIANSHSGTMYINTIKEHYNSVLKERKTLKSQRAELLQFHNIFIEDDNNWNMLVKSYKLTVGTAKDIHNNVCPGLTGEQFRSLTEYYFTTSNPEKHYYTDIELKMFEQSWSEHCKHNIFSSPIDGIADGLYREHIRKSTETIVENNLSDLKLASVFSDNAGGFIFDENYVVSMKVETHNTPSAIEPFGGAITGVLGVNRDIMGFGLGAKPIANTYGFFLPLPNQEYNYYYDKQQTTRINSPYYTRHGIVDGVRVAGNHTGVPTINGIIEYNERFIAKPLVYVGCIGIMPKTINGHDAVKKTPKDGDNIVIIGGKTGIDGLGGATFSSKQIDKKLESVVQMGDPFIHKKNVDAILELRDNNIYNAITDNGAGGLSSSIGEMGEDGFEVYLEKVSLKYHIEYAWHIWLSESQERMTLSVPNENIAKMEEILKKHEVHHVIIGKFTKSKRAIIYNKQEKILDLCTKFLNYGNKLNHLETLPIDVQQTIVKSPNSNIEIKIDSTINAIKCYSHTDSDKIFLIIPQNDLSDIALETEITDKSSLNEREICYSHANIAMSYDHEVQGQSVLKPLHGTDVIKHSDATIIRPVFDSIAGIANSQAARSIYNSKNSSDPKDDIDVHPYYMACLAIEEAVRQLIVSGANDGKIALLDNFCFSNANDHHRLWQLKNMTQACHDMSIGLGTPFISGKDSMFNDFNGYNEDGEKKMISAPPTLLISGIGIVDDIRSRVSIPVDKGNYSIFLLDLNLNKANDFNTTKKVEKNCKKLISLYKAYDELNKANIIQSGIAVCKGGVLKALLRMIIPNQVNINLHNLNIEQAQEEYPGRILIAIDEKDREKLIEILNKYVKINYSEMGNIIS